MRGMIIDLTSLSMSGLSSPQHDAVMERIACIALFTLSFMCSMCRIPANRKALRQCLHQQDLVTGDIPVWNISGMNKSD